MAAKSFLSQKDVLIRHYILLLQIKWVDKKLSERFSKQKRSEIMSKVRSTNTTPEMLVRSLLHNMGYRFRLHRKDLPGTPDIVLSKYKTVIEVRGCFWHRHKDCKRASTPKTNTEYWQDKFKKNIKRDRLNEKKLKELGWKVIVVWECEVKTETLITKLKHINKTDGKEK